MTTTAGQYMRALARDETAADPVVDVAARRVWEIAFGLAARRRFDVDSPLAEISRTVLAAVQTHAAAALPVIEAEMLVREALGEKVPTDDLDAGLVSGVHLLVFASLADELALGDDELDELIAQAEAAAMSGATPEKETSPPFGGLALGS